LVKIGVRAKRKTRAFEQEPHWRALSAMIGAILGTTLTPFETLLALN
jgi:hypothetical protein